MLLYIYIYGEEFIERIDRCNCDNQTKYEENDQDRNEEHLKIKIGLVKITNDVRDKGGLKERERAVSVGRWEGLTIGEDAATVRSALRENDSLAQVLEH